ncbi:unnamed protein product [Ceratitis capitata]|uniref:(Mediterranean fruit fly) hypothetical protein n=1 Tax=Ceratitis capitata TaxID=7213 RepID=A0A811UBY3_CERCA|nr:unnamed protein product [Ceratitis capitata]
MGMDDIKYEMIVGISILEYFDLIVRDDGVDFITNVAKPVNDVVTAEEIVPNCIVGVNTNSNFNIDYETTDYKLTHLCERSANEVKAMIEQYKPKEESNTPVNPIVSYENHLIYDAICHMNVQIRLEIKSFESMVMVIDKIPDKNKLALRRDGNEGLPRVETELFSIPTNDSNDPLLSLEILEDNNSDCRKVVYFAHSQTDDIRSNETTTNAHCEVEDIRSAAGRSKLMRM